MAPEQARGDSGLVDGRADVYALGGLLGFLLTGKAPPLLPGRTVPRPLVAVCRQALAADPADRYPGAAALAADVAAFLDRRPVRAYPEGPWDTARRLAAKYRTAVALVVAYLIMRLLLLAFLSPP
jgi:serine/threonine-protein kinase